MQRPAYLLLLSLFLLLPACLKVESTTILKKDGSGTYQQTSTLELERAMAYQQMLLTRAGSLGIPADEAEENPFAEVDAEAQAEALKGRHGLSDVVSNESSTEEADGKAKTRTYGLKLKFASLRDLYEAGVLEDTTVRLQQVQAGKAWRLTIRHIFDDTDDGRSDDVGSEGDEPEKLSEEQKKHREQLVKVRRALLKSVEPWWKTIQITRTLTLPGKVLKTNGVIDASGYRVTWKLAFKDLVDPANLRQDVTFAHVKDLALKPFELDANDIANAREAFEIERDERLREKRATADGDGDGDEK